MKLPLRFRPEVVADLQAGADWYDARRPGLGGEFLAQCKAALDSLAELPMQGTLQPDGVRSVRIRRFPYVIHFRVESQVVVVLAIMFGGRDPSAWRGRV